MADRNFFGLRRAGVAIQIHSSVWFGGYVLVGCDEILSSYQSGEGDTVPSSVAHYFLIAALLPITSTLGYCLYHEWSGAFLRFYKLLAHNLPQATPFRCQLCAEDASPVNSRAASILNSLLNPASRAEFVLRIYKWKGRASDCGGHCLVRSAHAGIPHIVTLGSAASRSCMHENQ